MNENVPGIHYDFDVHVPRAVEQQLTRAGIDVLTAHDDKATTFTDQQLLERATILGRVMVTQDIRFRALAENWQAQRIPFSGLVFAHPLQVTIGRMVIDLDLIARAASPAEISSQVLYLPL